MVLDDKKLYNQILEEAIERKGVVFHLDLLQEECAELVVQIAHFKRGRVGVNRVIEEMADVMIVLDSVKMALRKETGFQTEVRSKMERLQNRMAFKGADHG